MYDASSATDTCKGFEDGCPKKPNLNESPKSGSSNSGTYVHNVTTRVRCRCEVYVSVAWWWCVLMFCN